MKPTVYALLFSLLLTSCASIMNQPYKNITVYTTEQSNIIHNDDTVKTENNQADLIVERKKEPIEITAVSNSNTKTVEVKSKNSSMYWYNIVSNYGLGMLIDKNNPKRYSYPGKIYINSADTLPKYYKYGQVNNKGELYLHVSLPHINSFRLAPENESVKINTGFWGITLGLDYYHAKNQFLNLNITGVMDFPIPVVGAIDLSGELELMSSKYLSFSNNHKYKRFSVGYGLSFAKNTWDFRYYDRFGPPPPTREPVMKSNYSLGLVFPVYCQLGERFHIGTIYRPSFYRPNATNKFAYEHLISIDFAWKIRLKK